MDFLGHFLLLSLFCLVARSCVGGGGSNFRISTCFAVHTILLFGYSVIRLLCVMPISLFGFVHGSFL